MSWFQKLLCKMFNIGCPQQPPPVPPPDQPCRTPLIFCYYGGANNPAEFADHVNMTHIGAWGDWEPPGRDALIDSCIAQGLAAKAAGTTKLMFTLDFCLLTQTTPRRLLTEAVAAGYLQTFIQRLGIEGLIDNVAAWYVVDEPNIAEVNLNEAELATICALVRASIPFQAPLVTTFGASNGSYPGIHSFDWVGFDNYGAPIFSNGEYQHLASQLASGQRTVILPGGADPWREDPAPFYNWAQTDPRVAMIMPFMWQNPGGIAINGMAPQYRAVGLKVKATNP